MLIAWIMQNNSFTINLWVKKDVCLYLVSARKMKDKVLLLVLFVEILQVDTQKSQDADEIRGNLDVYHCDYYLQSHKKILVN